MTPNHVTASISCPTRRHCSTLLVEGLLVHPPIIVLEYSSRPITAREEGHVIARIKSRDCARSMCKAGQVGVWNVFVS